MGQREDMEGRGGGQRNTRYMGGGHEGTLEDREGTQRGHRWIRERTWRDMRGHGGTRVGTEGTRGEMEGWERTQGDTKGTKGT